MKTASPLPFAIPPEEIEVAFQRASGPGGQNVNKVATAVRLSWDIVHASGPDEHQRARLLHRLAARTDGDGVLRIHAQEYRTQGANRIAALHRLYDLVAEALREARPRRPTRPTVGSIRRRLENKRRRAETKRGRQDFGESD